MDWRRSIIREGEALGCAKSLRHVDWTPARLLGLPPERCMMVAAHNGDLVAARRCGFRTAFVPRPTEYGPGQTTDLKAEHDFDMVAADFVDLAAKLGC